jgi:hypothetical protein
MAIDAYAHKCDAVKTKQQDRVHTALEKMDDELDANFVVQDGYGYLENSEIPGNSGNSRYDWLQYAENTLHNQGYLTNPAVHVIIYDTPSGAGWSQWNVGGEESDGGYNNDKAYRSYTGNYGFAHVNTGADITDNYFQNTIIHEVGHLFDLIHADGAIRQNTSGDNFASPMCTWYVEQDCLTTNNNKPYNDLCTDDSGSKDACNHWQNLSKCTETGADNWHSTYIV